MLHPENPLGAPYPAADFFIIDIICLTSLILQQVLAYLLVEVQHYIMTAFHHLGLCTLLEFFYEKKH